MNRFGRTALILGVAGVFWLSVGFDAYGDSQSANATSGVSTTVGPYGSGGIPWTLPGSAAGVADDSRASSTPGVYSYTAGLYVSGFGFTIPAGATIDGIELSCEYYDAGSGVGSNIVQYRLTKDGTTLEDAYPGDDVTGGGPPDSVLAVGSSSDLWFTTWTPAEVNAGAFGVNLQFVDGSPSSGSYYVDAVTVTVHYTGGAEPIPTLGEWALVVFALFLCAGGAWQIKRMKRRSLAV